MMFLKSGALVFYVMAAILLFSGFFIKTEGLVEFGAAFIIGGLLMEFIGKYINEEHSSE